MYTNVRTEKRNRPPLSCEPCRSRKLKCNRELPCDTCVRRNKHSICSYAVNASRLRPGTSKVRNLKDRLDNVEQLVVSILSSNGNVHNNPQDGIDPSADSIPSTDDLENTPASSDTLASQAPHLHETGDGGVNYIDSSHWLSILDDIREVREHFSASGQSELVPAVERHRLISDTIVPQSPTAQPSLGEILCTLPSRPLCDSLLSWYFNSRFMVLGIVHPTLFQAEYSSFWNSPTTTSPLWIALLFSVLSITLTLRRASNAPHTDVSIQALQESTMQCLVLGRYTTANDHALEAFVLHLQGSFISGNAPLDLWFEMGTIIRLAFRMGYHRDPSKLKGISPFHGEMRRRIWMNIFQVDALMSFQLGFPSMIPTDFCDSEVPKNLEYSDLHIDMVALPPSRPFSEQTHILYGIVKASVMGVFKKITTHTQSLTVQPYDKTVALDNEMNRVYRAVPESYKSRDVGLSFLDHSSLVWQRCTIEVLYLKGLVVLHRRFVDEDFENQEADFSRKACVDAALAILSRQTDLNEACKPGGRLYEDRWMMATLPACDFLLAAMVVCLDLSFRTRSGRYSQDEGSEFRQVAAREYQALLASRQIWAAKREIAEARIATSALDLMIGKVVMIDIGFPHLDDETPHVINCSVDHELPYADTLSHVIDGSEPVDWSMWDQYLQGLDPSMFDTVA